MGCHQTEAEALAQLAALNINEPGARAVNLSPPEFMRAAARRGIKLHEQGLSGDGLMPQTVADARKMAAGTVTEAKWRKIAPWIARHMVDLEAVEGDEITAGVVAHLLWGSGSTKTAATRTMNYAQRVIDQLEADSDRRRIVTGATADTDTMTKALLNGDMKMQTSDELRELPPSYRPADTDDVPITRPACATCEYVHVMVDDEGTRIAKCAHWHAQVELDYYCDAYQSGESGHQHTPDTSAMGHDMEQDSVPVNWLSVADSGTRSVVYSTLEMRAAGESNTVVGYAAVFDSPSVDMGFTEYVTRGAFTKTLKDGADVRLLLDHDGAPLARTKSGTLRLSEDDRGLRIEADLDPANPLAQTVMSALRRGDMNQMSFAFRTIRDQWNSDRSVRELREVQLYDVSVVTFPAYEATVAEVRARSGATVKSESRTRLRKAQIQIAKTI
jgi:HK97 family phage prohead protease